MTMPWVPTIQSWASWHSSYRTKRDTPTLNSGISGVVMGEKRRSLKADVLAYSVKPTYKGLGESVPMQPRKRYSYSSSSSSLLWLLVRFFFFFWLVRFSHVTKSGHDGDDSSLLLDGFIMMERLLLLLLLLLLFVVVVVTLSSWSKTSKH